MRGSTRRERLDQARRVCVATPLRDVPGGSEVSRVIDRWILTSLSRIDGPGRYPVNSRKFQTPPQRKTIYLNTTFLEFFLKASTASNDLDL